MVVAGVATVACAAVWIGRVGQTPQAAQTESGAQPFVRSLRVDVLRELPHERDAYTQGLVWWNDRLFESAGLRQASTLRRLDPQTGQVRQRMDVAPEYWAEGLALVDDRLVMSNGSDRLTFRDPTTFESIGEQAVRLRGQPLRI